MGLRVHRQIGSLRKVLSQQTIGVLVRPPLPRALRIAEVIRVQAARDLAKKMGVEIKHVYLTAGDSDLVLFVDTPNGDNVAKFALALGSKGNVHTRTGRAWTEAEFLKLVSELP
jgi:uncharacterized protein with GYD domain